MLKNPKVGDKVYIFGSGYQNERGVLDRVRLAENSSCKNYYHIKLDNGNSTDWYDDGDIGYLSTWNNYKNETMDIKKSFNQLFLKEPQKSFQKAGVTDSSNQLTSDGRDIFLAWLLEKHGDEFKKDVVDPIVASQKDEK